MEMCRAYAIVVIRWRRRVQNSKQALEITPMQAHKDQKRTQIGKGTYLSGLFFVCALALTLSSSAVFGAQHGGGHPAAPHFSAPRQSAPRQQQPRQQSAPPRQMQAQPQQQHYAGPQQYHPGQQQHLPEWLNNHQNMTSQQRENALRNEPGFNHLPQDQQQRLINRMHTLNSLPPQQRERTLQRQEMYDRLTPEERTNVHGASQAFNQMSPDRQNAVRRAFQDLRAVPPGQRQSVIDSARFQQQFSPRERTVLGNMLRVEPYEPRAGAPQP